jgi:ferredoxin
MDDFLKSSDDLLSDALLRRCNPGLSDFGAGSVIALGSQCLRSAKAPSDCTACIDACPVDALVANGMQRPSAAKDCLRCGYCLSVCPTNAIAATTRTIQQITRLLLQATLRVDKLTITCSRSLGMLRLEAESSTPHKARAALEQLLQAETSDSLFVIPCLAMLSRELWFTVLNEIGVARIKELLVYLPFGQCELCPVNCKGGAVDTFVEELETAELFCGHQVTLVSDADDVPQYQRASVRGYLTSGAESDRRGVFTGLASQIKQSFDDLSRTGNRSADETLQIQARRETLSRTLLADDLKSSEAGPNKPILTQLRLALVESIGRNPESADTVFLLVSQTDDTQCDGCGTCLDACPLNARKLIDGKASADPLYCMGCSACLQLCPKQACSFVHISGKAYLRV